MPTVYLSPAAVLYIHERVLEAFGGAPGLRDQGGLEAAVGRPKVTYSGQELHPGLFEKAAALLESLCQNHPFVDGNKRVAYAATGLFLQYNGWECVAETEDAVSFMLEVASGKQHKEEIRIWIENHAAPYHRQG